MANDSYIFDSKTSIADYIDWTLFLSVLVLTGAGLISIYSATYDAGMSANFFKQLLFAGVGIVVMLVAALIDEKYVYNNAYIFYGASVAALIAVQFFGVEVAGTKGWFQFGRLSFQPAELAKIGTVLAIAKYHSKSRRSISHLQDQAVTFGLALIPVGLIFAQPDFGSASVILAMLAIVLLWIGFDLYLLLFAASLPIVFILSLVNETAFYIYAAAFALVTGITQRKKIFYFLVSGAGSSLRRFPGAVLRLAAVGLIIFIGVSGSNLVEKLPPHQQARIETFIDPGKDPLGKGYNVIQSVMAVGGGGVTGKGFMQGTQTQLRYIPKQWTDFIFCVPSEEFGFIGATLVIALLATISIRGVRIASISDRKFHSVLAVGISGIFFYHTTVNVGMAIGLMPVMGIPLPFMSYGGSSLVINMFMAGLLINSYKTYKLRSVNK